MNGSRTVLRRRHDATLARRAHALAAIYRRAIARFEEQKAAEGSGGDDAGKRDTQDSEESMALMGERRPESREHQG